MKYQVRVRVTDSMHTKLKQLAVKQGNPVAYLVRLAINDYLSRKGGFAK